MGWEWLKLWRRNATPTASATYRLCRLRHASLHPGASLVTPGVGGGSLGGGAAAALDEAGVGAEVVVGFQSSAREPVHPVGILARLEERTLFPESWNPEGLGASHRYRLVGLRRMLLDPTSATNKRIPTVVADPMADCDDDLAKAPSELVELLTALEGLDNAWPEHWREAFRTLPEAPLGQWATTLGWRLSREERMLLFEEPRKISEVLISTLDGLHLGLAPDRRREAVRAQTLTRRTTRMSDRMLSVVTDEDGWALFHPSDVASHGAAGAPASPAAGSWGPPSETSAPLAHGNAVVAPAPPGRNVLVRLTGGALETAETARKSQGAASHLLVRHGRLFLGGASLLRSANQDRLEFADPAQWLDVPNGVFSVLVTTLTPLGPDAADDQGGEQPDYIVQLIQSDAVEGLVASAEEALKS